MTASANGIWFASEYNRFIRDNLKETAPAKATAAGQYFVSSQTTANTIVARTVSTHSITTSQTTTSSDYTDLTTVGPTVLTTTGTTALVFFAVEQGNGTADAMARTSFEVTEASNLPAKDLWSVTTDGKPANQTDRASGYEWVHTLTPGLNRFTMKYRTGGTGTATFLNRHLVVMPLS